jgi:hypothetical protein
MNYRRLAATVRSADNGFMQTTLNSTRHRLNASNHQRIG